MGKKRKRYVSPLPDSLPAHRADSTRDASRITAAVLRRPRVLSPFHSLTQIEDLRRYTHEPARPLDPDPAPRPSPYRRTYRDIYGRDAPHSVRSLPLHHNGRMRPLRPRLQRVFLQPKSVIVCIRRRLRRSVLFALRRIGHGSGRKRLRRARWSESSYIRCK